MLPFWFQVMLCSIPQSNWFRSLFFLYVTAWPWAVVRCFYFLYWLVRSLGRACAVTSLYLLSCVLSTPCRCKLLINFHLLFPNHKRQWSQWSFCPDPGAFLLPRYQKPLHRNQKDSARYPLVFIHLLQQPKAMNLSNVQRVRPRGNWFNHRGAIMRSVQKKDKVRAEKAQTHAALCIAGLATAVASITAAESRSLDHSRMSTALASAAELLASHCSELAESAGADHDLVVSVVQSAINIQTPSGLSTLTAAALNTLNLYFRNYYS